MYHRLPAFVSGLTACDYLLWSWSSSGNHAVLALVSGLTLPPLAAVCAWLLLLNAARFIAGRARRSPETRRRGRIAAAASAGTGAAAASGVPAASLREEALASASGASSQPASRTLAA